MTNIDLRVGECVAMMNSLEPDSVHAIITDPPYDLINRTPDVKACEDCGRVLGGSDGKPDACPRCGGTLSRQRSVQGRGFMGKAWDATGVAFDPATWEAALRVLKPGGHIVAFGSPRTHHRMMVAIEDSGFELRDMLVWMYGTGFPKSQSIGKAIDKAAGATRTIVGRHQVVEDRCVPVAGNDGRCVTCGRQRGGQPGNCHCDKQGEPQTDAARDWEGWGTALKPAWEPIVLARKPLIGTMAQNIEAHGVGGLNIDATRIAGDIDEMRGRSGKSSASNEVYGQGMENPTDEIWEPRVEGRWPANVVLDPEAAALLDEQVGKDVSRFFYCAKASRKEREMGLEALPEVRRSDGREKDIENPRLRTTDRRNHHPTVKPLELMRWLTQMVMPPGGTVLDPFLGSGTSGIAVALEDPEATFIGIDLEAEYVEIAEARIAAWQTALAAGEVGF